MPIILNTLLVDGRAQAARAAVLAHAVITEKDLDALAPSPENSISDFAPLTWRLTKNETATVSLDPRTGWYAEIGAGQTAILFDRVMLYEPGRYQVKIPYAGEGELTLSVSCFALSGEKLGRAFAKSKLLRLEFVIPDECAAQRWSISGSAPEGSQPQMLHGNGAMKVRSL